MSNSTNTISMKFPTMGSVLRIKNRIKSCEKVYNSLCIRSADPSKQFSNCKNEVGLGCYESHAVIVPHDRSSELFFESVNAEFLLISIAFIPTTKIVNQNAFPFET